MSFKGMLAKIFELAKTWGPAQFVEPQTVETRQASGLRSEAKVRHHLVTIDEPTDFGGTDSAPNPYEVALAGLGASLEVTTRVYADYLDIPIKSIGTSIRGDLNLRGFLDLSPDAPSGPERIDVVLRIETDASDSDIERLMRQVHRSCPVLGLVRDPTPIDVRIERGDHKSG
jgi:uncharacterized OsmC-like protein